MGFLDNSTNNIIVDAVLTDLGRELLAQNDGSFSLVKFAFGDDEVDYGIIKKFGRTVGKEKIEKNTPVFEAQTNQNLALKNRLISISNPTLTKIPGVSLSGDGLDDGTISFTRTGAGSTREIVLTQTVADENRIDPELRDQAFIVRLPYKFIQLDVPGGPDSIDADDVATYIEQRDGSMTAIGGTKLTLNLSVRSLADSVFTFFGDSDNKSQISSTMTVTGINSGVTTELSIKISK